MPRPSWSCLCPLPLFNPCRRQQNSRSIQFAPCLWTLCRRPSRGIQVRPWRWLRWRMCSTRVTCGTIRRLRSGWIAIGLCCRPVTRACCCIRRCFWRDIPSRWTTSKRFVSGEARRRDTPSTGTPLASRRLRVRLDKVWPMPLVWRSQKHISPRASIAKVMTSLITTRISWPVTDV